MKYSQLQPLPNDGYDVAASFYGVFDDKILLGGGSGFITPLAEGGSKLLSNSIRLVDETEGFWKVYAHLKVTNNNKDYGFCNGVSIINQDVAYNLGGLKQIDGNISNSSDVIKVWIENNQLHYKIYENILPFSGEISGCKINNHKAFVIAGNCGYLVTLPDLDNHDFKCEKINFSAHIANPCLAVSNNNKVYLIGGYYPFDNSKEKSNQFVETQLIVWSESEVEYLSLLNFFEDPCVFLGASGLLKNETSFLIVGGVDKAFFTNAILNLSTLKDDQLAKFKKEYFNSSEQVFKFNNKLILFDLKTNSLTNLGTFNHGFAGNPSLIKYHNYYYILTSEVKAGVRLKNPIKFEL